MTPIQALNQLFPPLGTEQARRALTGLHLEFAFPIDRKPQYAQALSITEQLVTQHVADGGVTFVLDLAYQGAFAKTAESWFSPDSCVARTSRRDEDDIEPILPLNPLKGVSLEDLDEYYKARFGGYPDTQAPSRAYALQVASALRRQGHELSFPFLTAHARDTVSQAEAGVDEAAYADFQSDCEFVNGVSYNQAFDHSGLRPSTQSSVDVVSLLREGRSAVINLPRPGDQQLGHLLLASVALQWHEAYASGTALPPLHLVIHDGVELRTERFNQVIRPLLAKMGVGITVLPGYCTSREGQVELQEGGWSVVAFPNRDDVSELELRTNQGTRRLSL